MKNKQQYKRYKDRTKMWLCIYLLFVAVMMILFFSTKLSSQVTVSGKSAGNTYNITNNPDAQTIVEKAGQVIGLVDTFNIVSDTTGLKAFDPTDGGVVFLRGLASTHNIGAGWFVHIDSIYKEGIYAYGSLIAAKQWVRLEWLKFPGIVNVKWCGARGDSSTNDATAISNALFKATTDCTDFAIHFPTGNYILNDSLKCNNMTVKMFADDKDLTRIICSTPNDSIDTMFRKLGTNSYVKNITFIYNSNVELSFEFFTMSGQDSITFENCRFLTRHRPLSVTNCDYLTIKYCEFGNGEGSFHTIGQCNHITVEHCNFWQSDTSISNLACINCPNTDSSSFCYNTIKHGNIGILLEDDANYNDVSHNKVDGYNTCEKVAFPGIWIQGGIKNTITFNKVSTDIGSGVSSSNANCGIILDRNPVDNTNYGGNNVIGNEIRGNFYYGIYGQVNNFDTRNLFDVKIADNYIYSEGFGIYFISLDNDAAVDTMVLDVQGNVFVGQEEKAIYDEMRANLIFKNNTILRLDDSNPVSIGGETHFKEVSYNTVLFPVTPVTDFVNAATLPDSFLIEEHNKILPTQVATQRFHEGFVIESDSISLNSTNFLKDFDIVSDTLWFYVDDDTFGAPIKP